MSAGPLEMRPGMPAAEREGVRAARRQDQAARDAAARAHAAEHPLTAEERSSLPRIVIVDPR